MVGFNPAQANPTRLFDAALNSNPQALASSLLTQNSRAGGTDIAGLKASLDQIAATDPALASSLRNELSGVLSPVEQGQLAANYGDLGQGTLLAAKPTGAAKAAKVDLGSLALDVTQLSLDIVGIFEPTPFADGANTLISLGRGDWFGAITSAAGIIPYVGDAAKLGKLGKWAETVAKAVDAAASNPAFRKAIEPALREIMGAIDSVGLNRLPKEVQSQFAKIRNKIDGLINPKYIPS